MRDQYAFDRRQFLTLAGSTTLAAGLGFSPAARAATPRQSLTVGTRTIEVNGKAATVFGITDTNGRSGLILDAAGGFNVSLTNATDVATIMHWHGLTPPFGMDGNPLSQQPIAPGASMAYSFDLPRGGTNWMHSHFGLQETQLMAASLIVREGEPQMQEVVVLLHDFSFTPPEEILATLKGKGTAVVGSGTAAMDMGTAGSGSAMPGMAMGGMAGMDHSGMTMNGNDGATATPGMNMGGMAMGAMDNMDMDLNDITFDAYLANDRTLTDPEIVGVDKGDTVLLRIINGAASTNFWIDLGQIEGTVKAVDGMPVQPLRGSRFGLAIAQRIDIEVTMPTDGAAVPVLAQREGDIARTGIVLAPSGATVTKIAAAADTKSAPVLLELERQLVAASPLSAKPVTLQIMAMLTGDMQTYVWGIDGRTFDNRQPLEVSLGDRVEITMHNMTMMSHPMHLHGHHFQVVGIDGQKISGAMRDTVLVPAMGMVTIQFDADNPGEWPLHCHNLYHMAAGMMTTVKYI
ncbi:Multicopper oxidase [Loktanella atrilutea]|uniref:Multicopper oxidase n=1 Tax=Loktanella atrilutea TaxID=366533 RepID=A0A1M5ES35_LOKAT|nr:multicopper oxidase domain-containing protein [Loktanella atrilutea]SHF81954.1 Multicopper oxidase [Loktanella atrilutea]